MRAKVRYTKWVVAQGTVHFLLESADVYLCCYKKRDGHKRTNVKLGTCERCKFRLERLKKEW